MYRFIAYRQIKSIPKYSPITSIAAPEKHHNPDPASIACLHLSMLYRPLLAALGKRINTPSHPRRIWIHRQVRPHPFESAGDSRTCTRANVSEPKGPLGLVCGSRGMSLGVLCRLWCGRSRIAMLLVHLCKIYASAADTVN